MRDHPANVISSDANMPYGSTIKNRCSFDEREIFLAFGNIGF